MAFALDLVAKDLALADALAARVGCPHAAARDQPRRWSQQAIEAGLGQADLSALATLLRREAD